MLQIVAIDGPVGVGKSTTARRVAEELGFRHLDTGAMYRAVAWKVMQLPQSRQDDPGTLAEAARNLRIDLEASGEIYVDGMDVTLELRDEAVSHFVTRVADNFDVRRALVNEQRRLGMLHSSVLEGRDIGTVVFPDAACKIYLDAAPEVRVDRRLAQLQGMGKQADRERIYEALLQRDASDRAREWGALKLAEDATLLDTTHYTEEMVVQLICALVGENPIFRQKLPAFS